MGRGIQGLNDEAMALLVRYPFPGNVRELENVLEHAYIVTRGPIIGLEDLPNYIVKGRLRIPNTPVPPSQSGQSWSPNSASLDRQGLTECLERNLWNISRAAQELGIHRTTLWRKLKKFNISKP
jgi:transcriptional regulator with PAS, ATPase and Fis domain